MTRTFQRFLSVLGIALCTGLSLHADAQRYTFQPLVLSDTTFDPFSFGAPVLNSSGFVAFSANLLDGTSGIFRSDGTAVTTIADTQGNFNRFGDPTINASGQVGFEGSPSTPRGEGIFRGSGGAVTLIAGTRNVGDFDFVNASPSINSSGRVAFIGERIVGGNFIDGVYAGSGGAVGAIYDTTSAFSDFTGNPSLNDNGTVAFLATLNNGAGGLFVGNGGAFQTAADDSGIFTSVFGFSDPSLNARGDVAFTAGLNPDPNDPTGSVRTGVFLYENGVLQTVLEGDFSQIASLSDVSLNNNGDVAFVLSPDFTQQVLLTGADLLNDRVIGTGDLLLGRTITSLTFSREGFNDNGQLAFTALFDDGTSGVFLASPLAAVPEPGSFALLVGVMLAGGSATLRLRRKRTVSVC